MKNLLIVGFSEREAAAIALMVNKNYPSTKGFVLPRSLSPSLPTQTKEARECDSCILDLVGLGLLSPSNEKERQLLTFLGGRSAILVTAFPGEWELRKLPQLGSQVLVWVKSPFTATEVKAALDRMQAGPMPQAAPEEAAASRRQSAPQPPPPARSPKITQTLARNEAPAWKKAIALADRLRARPSPSITPAAREVAARDEAPPPSRVDPTARDAFTPSERSLPPTPAPTSPVPETRVITPPTRATRVSPPAADGVGNASRMERILWEAAIAIERRKPESGNASGVPTQAPSIPNGVVSSPDANARLRHVVEKTTPSPPMAEPKEQAPTQPVVPTSQIAAPVAPESVPPAPAAFNPPASEAQGNPEPATDPEYSMQRQAHDEAPPSNVADSSLPHPLPSPHPAPEQVAKQNAGSSSPMANVRIDRLPRIDSNLRAVKNAFPQINDLGSLALAEALIANRGRLKLQPPGENVGAQLINIPGGWIASRMTELAIRHISLDPIILAKTRFEPIKTDCMEAALREEFQGRPFHYHPLDTLMWELMYSSLRNIELKRRNNIVLKITRFPNFNKLKHCDDFDIRLAALCARAPISVAGLETGFPQNKQAIWRFVVTALLSGHAILVMDRSDGPAGDTMLKSVSPKRGFFRSLLDKLF